MSGFTQYYFLLGSGGILGNLNIFRGFLTVDKMKSITNGSLCGSKGDFLAWKPDDWKPNGGKFRYFEIDAKHLCFHLGLTSDDNSVCINKFGL